MPTRRPTTVRVHLGWLTALVETRLERAAETVLHAETVATWTLKDRYDAEARGYYAAAMDIASLVDVRVYQPQPLGWPKFSEWADALKEAANVH